MMNTCLTVRGSAPGRMTALEDLPLCSGTTSCTVPTSRFAGLGGAVQIGQHALTVGGIVGAAGDDAVFPRAGDHARCVEAGVQDGHHLAAGGVHLHHHAQQIAPVTDDGIVHRHAVRAALIQRKTAKFIQRVTADDKGRHIARLRICVLDACQCLVGVVLGLDAVVVHHLLAQLCIFGFQLLVPVHHIVDAGVFFPHRGRTAAEGRRDLLEGGEHHAQQLLRGCRQAAVGTGIRHDAHQEHRHDDQDLEFPGVKKIFQRVCPPIRSKPARSQKKRGQPCHPRKGPVCSGKQRRCNVNSFSARDPAARFRAADYI